jgi:UDP-GlcNAc:undecaprenyl-phosphate/decaprenyl-phosphate GlcNAc-1-phosphate transferase
MWIIGVLTAAVACVTTWAVTPAIVRAAHRFGALDHPGPRKIHSAPIPRVGGLAVFAGFSVGLVFAAFATGYATNSQHGRAGYWAALAIAAFGMLIMGLIDDLRGLTFQWKFAFQILAACALWWAGFRIEALGVPLVNATVVLGWWSLPLTVLWIIGITNAFNLIDGLDGLAAGTALITTTVVSVIAIFGGHVAVSAVGVALVGALAGFLRYNFNPAQIFLGDSGSMFLGFSLAVMSIHGSQKNVTVVAVLAPLLILGYPILDTGFAIARRLNTLRTNSEGHGGLRFIVRNAHQVFLPDRGHLHHRLLELGLSHRAAVLSLYACALAMAAGALALVVLASLEVALVLAASLTLITFAFFAFVLVRSRFLRDAKVRRSLETPPTSSRPAASGGSLGRS